MKIVTICVMALSFTMPILSAGLVSAQDYLSPSDLILSHDKETLYVLASTGKQLIDFDLQENGIRRSLELPAEPTDMVMSGDGETLYVAGGGPEGRVWIVNSGSVVGEIETGHTPMSPIVSPDGKWLYVCNRFDNDVSIIDLESGKTMARVAVLREPIAAVLTPDGKRLFVANHIPDGRADIEYVASQVSIINTETQEVKTLPLVNGAEGMRAMEISPDGKKIFATHLMARFLVPTTQLERGWVSTNALSVIDVASETLQYTVLLDDIEQGFSNPWAIGFSPDGKTLVVSSTGNQEISLIDLPALTAKIASRSSQLEGEAHLNAHNDLSFLSEIRKRVKLKGIGPRSLVVDEQVVYVGNYFSDAIEIVRSSSTGHTESDLLQLGSQQAITPERLGEIYFNDSALCFQNWLSCATCHPDARTDGLNWDLMNDGIGNPKNVKSMLYAHKTPPAMWLGVRADAETAVRAGIRHIQFSVRPEEDALAIDAYLKSLKPIPSPHLVDGRLSDSAMRGEILFEQVGCAYCHPSPLFTDFRLHDAGFTSGPDEGKPVDVPHLIEAWRTAPYLHDGRAATMKDVVTTFEHGNSRGKLSELSEDQIDDLVEYLLSL
ncbi:Lactonase, 7-bladed beta-propeller [Novipirellula aureliae]|uniref:Lactonase, 7-bladed beta-propeller n=1 Tax=Novipirellula aureliae TaxID=2527966 RepID=A0A5C6EDL4_9BACT|nr:PD40 domain-containing protein [Novipirellula aureliae]TWU45319.1 Lactonase, 7-bladed beta-propeller [Novipirellula aureliae]